MKRKQLKILFTLFILAGGLMLATPRPVYSCASPCPIVEHTILRDIIENEHEVTRALIPELMAEHVRWFMSVNGSADSFFMGYVAPAMTKMTETLTTVGLYQMALLGEFFDAKHQLEVERVFQKLTAEAHKDYHVSMDMCVLGTTTRNMRPASQLAKLNASVLLKRSQDRQLGYKNTSSAEGVSRDRTHRVAQFKELYCDPSDMDTGFASVCPGGGQPERMNRDIDYGRLLGSNSALNLDFSDAVITDDEEDLIALGTYLFAHRPLSRISEAILKVEQNQDEYLDLRSVVAKRSVIENSFYTIAAMKGAGTIDNPGNYVNAIYRNFGIPASDIEDMVGDRPGYFAQLEVAGQKIYQDPEFFSNLYDKPANVERKHVAMQAVELVVDREAYLSELRQESLLALWLELETIDYHEAVQNRINWLDSTLEKD